MNNSPADRESPLWVVPGNPSHRFYDHAVEALRTRHNSRRTELACMHWTPRSIRFRGLVPDGHDIRTV